MIELSDIKTAFGPLIKDDTISPSKHVIVHYRSTKSRSSHSFLILQIVPMEHPRLAKYMKAHCNVFLSEEYMQIVYYSFPYGGKSELAPGDDDGSVVNVEIPYKDMMSLIIDGTNAITTAVSKKNTC